MRLRKVMGVIHLNTPDRVPLVLEYAGFAARAARTRMADFFSSRIRCVQTPGCRAVKRAPAGR